MLTSLALRKFGGNFDYESSVGTVRRTCSEERHRKEGSEEEPESKQSRENVSRVQYKRLMRRVVLRPVVVVVTISCLGLK